MTTTVKTRASKAEILDAFNKLQGAKPAGKFVTREEFRKETSISTSDVEYWFGTFAELKREAGAAPTRADTKLTNAIAKVVTVARRDGVAKERAEYSEKYIRGDDSRYKTILVATDLHDKEIDPFFLRVMIDTATRVQPDNIVYGGDVFDLPEYSRYTVDPREWDVVGRIKYAHSEIFKPMREASPDSQFDLIEGNHECISEDTEVLTDYGWITADKLNGIYDPLTASLVAPPKIASWHPTTHKIGYHYPIAVAQQDNREIFEITSTFKRERITGNHNLVHKDGTLKKLEDWGSKELKGENLTLAINNKPEDELAIGVDIARLAIWLMTTASIMRDDNDQPMILFNKPPGRIERRIKSMSIRLGIDFEKVGRNIELTGPKVAGLIEVITGHSSWANNTRYFRVPDWFNRLPIGYGRIIAEELTCASTQGFFSSKSTYFNGWLHEIGDALQWFLVSRGVPAAINKLPMGQYILVFNETDKLDHSRGNKITKKVHNSSGKVISIQTVNGTLITRVDGKINFTGNCRLVKHLADFSPATRAILGDLHGMTIGDLFGLKDYEINYVAKADLKAYSAKEHDRELQNNYKVYYNTVLVHHFPHARNMGLPGVNGHHHRHQVWPMFNVHQGAYEWHQLGAGHKRSASYCEGEYWHNGFALIHVDTLTKSANIEYIPITNMAVVGGKFYHREPHEVIV